MSRTGFYDRVNSELEQQKADGLTKIERPILSPQSGTVTTQGRESVVNLCANNYLGLADNPEVIQAATTAMAKEGYGMASVRFICGTTPSHITLEKAIANYIGTEASITFAACFDANGAVFEPLLGPEDAIVSDSLNHASLIDGIRLCKAKRYRFKSRNLADLQSKLKQARLDGARTTLIVTDGVFSMDGYIADLASIVELAERYLALVMVDDCHATGVVGPSGRGTPALHDVSDRVDIVTSTLGKALGGAMGGFVAARQPIIDLLRQRARPYLFSNALSPSLVGGARAAIRLASGGHELRSRLHEHAGRFRGALTDAGFNLTGADHPIVPVMVGDAHIASAMASRLEELGVFVTPFSYPIVPRGQARIRTQLSAAHTIADIEQSIEAFIQVGHELKILGASE